MGLMIHMSVGDILLAEAVIKNHMEENNITDPKDVDLKIIQEKYNEIMKKQMWEDPEGT